MMKTISFALFAVIFSGMPVTVSAEHVETDIPTNDEMFEMLQASFPAALCMDLKKVYTMDELTSSPALLEKLNSLQTANMISNERRGDNVIIDAERAAGEYVVPSLSTGQRLVLAGAVMNVLSVEEVAPSVDFENTYEVKMRVQIIHATSFGKTVGYKEGEYRFFTHVTPTSNGVKFTRAAGINNDMIASADETKYGRMIMRRVDFCNNIESMLPGEWEAGNGNVYSFDGETMRYSFYDGRREETTEGTFRYDNPSMITAGVQLLPDNSRNKKITIEATSETGVILLKAPASPVGKKYTSRSHSAAQSEELLEAIAVLKSEFLPGKWMPNKAKLRSAGYHLTFNEDGTATAFLPAAIPNYGRTGDDKFEKKTDVTFEGPYWIYSPEERPSMFAIVWGPEGDLESNDYIWLFKSPIDAVNGDAIMSLALREFFRQ